jgi:hypothetical protein
MFRHIGAIVAGLSSALVTGGHLFTSPYHFGVFIAFLFVGMVLGAIVDSVLKN